MKHTHKTRLLAYLEELGNTRLAATVCDLRKEGFEIVSTDTKVPTRWGTETTVTKYIYSKSLS